MLFNASLLTWNTVLVFNLLAAGVVDISTTQEAQYTVHKKHSVLPRLSNRGPGFHNKYRKILLSGVKQTWDFKFIWCVNQFFTFFEYTYASKVLLHKS